jgi:hypothetical protein
MDILRYICVVIMFICFMGSITCMIVMPASKPTTPTTSQSTCPDIEDLCTENQMLQNMIIEIPTPVQDPKPGTYLRLPLLCPNADDITNRFIKEGGPMNRSTSNMRALSRCMDESKKIIDARLITEAGNLRLQKYKQHYEWHEERCKERLIIDISIGIAYPFLSIECAEVFK